MAERQRIAIVGAGAAGTLTAACLLTEPGVAVHLIDPSPHTGRGRAYGTRDRRHLLNVPAGRMSASTKDPDGFVRWLGGAGAGGDFVSRWTYGSYLADRLADAARSSSSTLIRTHERVTGLRPGLELVLASGSVVTADAAVLALGTFATRTRWAPPWLAGSPRFVADPWLPGALDAVPDTADVLLVGSGLTAVDVAVTLAGAGRRVHLVSRHGWLPRAHSPEPAGVIPAPELPVGRGLGELRAAVLAHFRSCIRTSGDWRSAIDGLRPVTAELWQGLSLTDRIRFLGEDSRMWEVHRHRMAPAAAEAVATLRDEGLLTVRAAEVDGITETAAGLLVRLSGGEELTVGAIVNCAGAQDDLREVGDPLLDSLLSAEIATPGPLGLGLDTDENGRLVSAAGLPLWTLGAPRRGSLWETTAIPEIRDQAQRIAEAIRDRRTSRGRRRDRDQYGLPLTANAAAAEHYREGLGRLLRVESGAGESMLAAVEADPSFALGHAVIALLGKEGELAVTPAAALAAARAAAGDERERGFVAAVDALVTAAEPTPLLRHIRAHPRDALAVSIAVPTIAFGGVTAGRDTWELVEGLAAAYGRDWWYLSQLAFIRQDQSRWDEAEDLAVRALADEPGAGHAVHARAHVFYETGRHEEGRRWLDSWIEGTSREANQLAHFSWHAALHDIALCDVEAVRRRYLDRLAPPLVTGARSLVDSASLLWRCQVTDSWPGATPELDQVPCGWLSRPPNAFVALHSAVALAAAADRAGLAALRTYAEAQGEPVFGGVVAGLCEGLRSVLDQDFGRAADTLAALRDRLPGLGGSAAQRDIVEETLLYAQIQAGRQRDAAALLDARLDRRPSELDRRRLTDIRIRGNHAAVR
ncbi:FAD/NAD(P)-binding protein [Amycolatopsis thailandensis]|uniref:FAD/NAD(P)-binding protein n=1 Tax=Amycolatopsis thailandensis TaxID=589330 RepID=UPI003667F7D7